MNIFSENLRNLRKAKGLTQRDLAKLLNCSSSTIGLYETGDRNPDVEMLIKIADFFNVTIDYLLKGDTSSMEEKMLLNLYRNLNKKNKKIAAIELRRMYELQKLD